MQHIIKKQVIEIKLASRESAFSIQQEMSNFYWKKILPALENGFDELSGEKEIIQIDKLEINLGELQAGQLTSSYSLAEICPGLIAQIKEKIKIEAKKNASRGTGNITAQWLYYMKNGHLNWNTVKADASWKLQVLEGFAVDFSSIGELRRVISSDKNALHRITALHNDLFLVRLTEVLTATKQKALFAFLQDLEKLLRSHSAFATHNPEIIKRKVWEKILAQAALDKEKALPEKLIAVVVEEVMTEGVEKDWLLMASAAQAHSFHKIISEIKKKRDEHRADAQQTDKEKLESEQMTVNEKGHSINGPAKDNDNLNELTKDVKEKEAEMKKEEQSSSAAVINESLKEFIGETSREDPEVVDQFTREEIFADHAGLVLLHPFFSSLFNRLSLTRDGKFADASSQLRAVYILYYLATGREDPEEFELVIPKFLAGYPLQKAIPFPVFLEQNEKEETFNLLEITIEKWKILGKTSPSGLQESFLQRRGKLSFRDEACHLQVEAGPFDMLIDHLPWNLSILKLPWMKQLLKVEWR